MTDTRFDPRRHRIYDRDVGPKNLGALASLLEGYAMKIEQALEMFEGQEQYRRVYQLNEKASRAYKAIERWTVDKPDIDFKEIMLDMEANLGPATQQGFSYSLGPENAGKEQYVGGAQETLLEAERKYLDVIERAEEEVEFPVE